MKMHVYGFSWVDLDGNIIKDEIYMKEEDMHTAFECACQIAELFGTGEVRAPFLYGGTVEVGEVENG